MIASVTVAYPGDLQYNTQGIACDKEGDDTVMGSRVCLVAGGATGAEVSTQWEK